MKRLLQNTSIASLLVVAIIFTTTGLFAGARQIDDNAKPIIQEVEQTLMHYRSWLESPAFVSVVKGTNHAARATMMIDNYLRELSEKGHEQAGRDGRVGIHGIRALLMKQMRIHVDLLSTTVPVGIVSYDSDVENAVEEQLNLLEQTLREFERHQSGG